MSNHLNLYAFGAEDASLLAELLRFYLPPDELQLRLVLPAEFKHDSELEYPRLNLNEHPPKESIYALANQNQEQVQHLNQFYFCQEFKCLKLAAGIPKLSLQLFGDLKLCCLASEAQSLPQITHKYLDLRAYLQDSPEDKLLITQNTLIVKALCINDPDDLWLLAFDDKQLLIDLRLDANTASYHRAYRQLAALICCLEKDEELDRLSLQRCHQNSAKSYGFFAEFYDRYMSHVDYSSWLDMVLSWAHHFQDSPPKTVLEMACGTARIAEQLVFKGLEVDAFDGSAFMLHEANKKSFKPKLYLACLTDAPKKENHYDLILCLFDSVNYLLKIEELSLTLQNAWRALKPGGIFVFDISTINNSQQNFYDTIQKHQFGSSMIVHHAFFDELRLRQRSFLTLFRKKPLGFVMSREEHCQRVYYHREIMSVIKNSSLELLGIFSPEIRGNLINRKQQNLDVRYPRLFYMLQKKLK